MRQRERELPRGPGRVGRCRPEHRLRRLRQPVNGRRLERAGRDQRRGAPVGRRPRRRRLGRRQHRRLWRAEPGAVPAGAEVPRHVPQRRHVGQQRLQRDQRRPVPGHERIRHGNRPRDAGCVAAGHRAHGHPPAVVVSGSQAFGGSPTFSRLGQLCRLRGTALRRHPQHQRAHLHDRGHVHAHQPDAAGRELHAGGHCRAAGRPSRAPTQPTTPSSTRAPRTTSRSTWPRSTSPCRARRPTGGRRASRAPTAPPRASP